MSDRGDRAFIAAISLSAVFALIKFAAGVFSGSMVVLASSADSLSDAAMSAVNRWGYRYARTPADADHPWGHGKVEGALATGQGLMLSAIVISLVASAISRMTNLTLPRVDIAIVVLIASGLMSGGLTWMLNRAARGERSLVLRADAAHYRVDLLTNAAAVGGLLLVGVTQLPILDPLIALGMAGLMGSEAWKVLRSGWAELMDEALPPEDQARVEAILAENSDDVLAFHGLRTRRSGPRLFVEVHAVLEPDIHLADAHQIVQDIAQQIQSVLPGARVLVHPDAAGLKDEVDTGLEVVH